MLACPNQNGKTTADIAPVSADRGKLSRVTGRSSNIGPQTATTRGQGSRWGSGLGGPYTGWDRYQRQVLNGLSHFIVRTLKRAKERDYRIRGAFFSAGLQLVCTDATVNPP